MCNESATNHDKTQLLVNNFHNKGVYNKYIIHTCFTGKTKIEVTWIVEKQTLLEYGYLLNVPYIVFTQR